MYTELHFNAELDNEKIEGTNVTDILKYMTREYNAIPDNENGSKVPDHPFFKCERWQNLFTMDSYYFAADTHSTIRLDRQGGWYLCVRSNVKNYDDEIKEFLDWIKPYLKEDNVLLGFYRYENDEYPTLLYADREIVVEELIK